MHTITSVMKYMCDERACSCWKHTTHFAQWTPIFLSGKSFICINFDYKLLVPQKIMLFKCVGMINKTETEQQQNYLPALDFIEAMA